RDALRLDVAEARIEQPAQPRRIGDRLFRDLPAPLGLAVLHDGVPGIDLRPGAARVEPFEQPDEVAAVEVVAADLHDAAVAGLRREDDLEALPGLERPRRRGKHARRQHHSNGSFAHRPPARLAGPAAEPWCLSFYRIRRLGITPRRSTRGRIGRSSGVTYRTS